MALSEGWRQAYAEFCAAHRVWLSFQPWWLDAVCGLGQWSAAVVKEGAGGVWPWFRMRRWGVPVVQLPPYTTYGGPWLGALPTHWPTWRRLRSEYWVLGALMAQLPGVCFFRQNCWPWFGRGLPMAWQGFHLGVRYTYILPPGSSELERYAALKGALRTELRHAQESVVVEEVREAGRLFGPYACSMERRGLHRPYEPFARLVAALQEQGCGVGWVSRCVRSGNDAAALLLAFDGQRAAVITAGRALGDGPVGALHRLYWEAICFCAERGLTLDFEGSMLPGVEAVFRAFGGQPQPYLRVTRIFSLK